MVTVYPPPSHDKFQLEKRGPYLIRPQPMILSSVDAAACDILFLKTGAVKTLETPAATSQSTSAIKGIHNVMIVPDPKHSSLIYCYHEHGVDRIDMSSWVDKLNEAFKISDEESQLLAINQIVDPNTSQSNTKFGSRVVSLAETKPIANESKSNPVVGLTVIPNLFVGYSYIMLTGQPYTLSGSLLPFRITAATAPFTADKSANKQVNARQPTESRFKRYEEPDLNQHIFTTKFIHSAKGNEGKYPNFLDEDTLREFGQRVKALRVTVTALYNAANHLGDHFKIQHSEQTQQKLLLNQNVDMLTSVDQAQQRLTDRIARCVEKQNLISEKTDTILQILVDHNQPQLSEAEILWGHEIEAVKES
ncbi:hypothetical protein HK096_004103, partial [Nowakowskiella sp. JEL0078]